MRSDISLLPTPQHHFTSIETSLAEKSSLFLIETVKYRSSVRLSNQWFSLTVTCGGGESTGNLAPEGRRHILVLVYSGLPALILTPLFEGESPLGSLDARSFWSAKKECERLSILPFLDEYFENCLSLECLEFSIRTSVTSVLVTSDVVSVENTLVTLLLLSFSSDLDKFAAVEARVKLSFLATDLIEMNRNRHNMHTERIQRKPSTTFEVIIADPLHELQLLSDRAWLFSVETVMV